MSTCGRVGKGGGEERRGEAKFEFNVRGGTTAAATGRRLVVDVLRCAVVVSEVEASSASGGREVVVPRLDSHRRRGGVGQRRTLVGGELGRRGARRAPRSS
jgi:hypothetical protein